MELIVLDNTLTTIGILDSFESIIWSERYWSYSDFEIHTPIDTNTISLLQEGYFLYNKDSDYVMIIETRELTTDVENGSYMTVRGRSLESILDRRIIWGQITLTGSLQNGIKSVITKNIINPTIASRKIDNFIFEDSTDTDITNLQLETQLRGENIYEAIETICQLYEIGFKINLSDDMKFIFKLYSGKDRSYAQEANPFVVFSPSFDNLLNTNYLDSSLNKKTVALVCSENNSSEEKTLSVASSNYEEGSGLLRREIFVDAGHISETKDDATTMSTTEYSNILKEKGLEYLDEYTYTTSFEGEADTTGNFVYGKDFSMGDILQITNEYGMTCSVRVIELVRSEGPEGYTVYPTFTTYI